MSQQALFETPTRCEENWVGMPEFNQQNLMPYKSVTVHFRNIQDQLDFAKLMNQQITKQTKSIWYPKPAKGTTKHAIVKDTSMNPKYPVYIISKGRWDTRLTAKALEEIEVPYKIVVEPQEYENYASVIDPNKILVLPFSNLGQGSIPARNWVWDHSISIGAERHWILDDNIGCFMFLRHNKKIRCVDGSNFKHCEDFTDRYENIAMSGMNYQWFAKQNQKIPAYVQNTRVYSCILLNNKLPHRWRGRYNEDTDLSIRFLKDGYCTVLFNAFLADKMTTMTMKGGNTEELYLIDDGRLKMAQSLVDQHPDIVRVSWKFNRHQHHVDYSVFKKNKLIRKQEY